MRAEEASGPIAHPPAKCRSCGQIVPATSVGIRNSSNITISGSQRCPRCGGVCDILEGTYNAVDDVLQLISGPASTLEALKALAESLSASRAEGRSPEEAIKKASAISPTLDGIAKRFPWASTWAFLSLVVAAAQLVVSLQQPPQFTREDAAKLFAVAAAEMKKAESKDAAEAEHILNEHLGFSSAHPTLFPKGFSPATEGFLKNFAQQQYGNTSYRIKRD